MRESQKLALKMANKKGDNRAEQIAYSEQLVKESKEFADYIIDKRTKSVEDRFLDIMGDIIMDADWSAPDGLPKLTQKQLDLMIYLQEDIVNPRKIKVK